MENATFEKCLICNNLAELIHKDFPGYQKPFKFYIYHCKYCNTSFSLPRTDAYLIYEKIYKNVKNIPGYDRYWYYAENIKNQTKPLRYLCENEDIYWAINEGLKLIVNNINTSMLLDIGSGLGYLTYALNMAGYNTIGADISIEAVNNAKSRFGNYYLCADISELIRLFPGKFDVVILAELLEHVESPIDFIESVKKLLKPYGSIIITTPNKSFYSDDLIWATDLPPVHMWWFSEESFKVIAERGKMLINYINYHEFYKKKWHAVDMNFYRNLKFIRSVLNSDSSINPEINFDYNKKVNFLKQQAKRYFYPFLKLYGNIYKLFNDNIKICDKKGVTLCVILTNK